MNHYYRDEANQPERKKPRVAPTYGEHHRFVLRAMLHLRKIGALATDEAIWNTLVKFGKAGSPGQIKPSGARTRRHELVADFKFVVQSKVPGRTESGRKCASYVLTQAGLEKARAEYEASRQMRLDVERAA